MAALALVESLNARVLLHAFVIGADGVVYVTTENSNQATVLERVGTRYQVSIYNIITPGSSTLHARESFSAGVAGFFIDGSGGDDFLHVKAGIDVPVTLQGGAGNDHFLARSSARMQGQDGNDGFDVDARGCTLDGGAGDDLLRSFAGGAMLTGGAGNDVADYSTRTAPLLLTLDGLANDGAAGTRDDNVGSDVETILGGLAGDLLVGDDGNNVLLGNGGRDTLRGGGGNDTLAGGSKNDLLDGGGGGDQLVGGAGVSDTADYSGRVAPLSLTLDGLANDGADGEGDAISPSIENLAGGAGADFLLGSGRANVLLGNAGDDTLSAGSGDDLLDGGAGADHLAGHSGNDTLFARDSVTDTLSGGSGIDTAHSDPLDVLDSIP